MLRTSGIGHRIEVVTVGRPADMMEIVRAGLGQPGGVVFGFGNIGGPGETLVRHWREAGEPVLFTEGGTET
jgi:hypothetical protein